jgi:uncharacterized protein
MTAGLASGKPRGKTVFVFAHGYGGNRQHWSELMSGLVDLGLEAIAPAMPAHEESPDPTSGFGEKESDVVVATAQWAATRYAEKPRVVLVGVSMGGAAAWLASAKAPELVDAVVSEGAFARFDEAMDQWFRLLMPGGPTALSPVVFFAKRMSGIDPGTINPVEAAERWKGRPALVIQATNDRLILGDHAERLAAASGAPIWRIDDCAHAQGCSVSPLEYLSKLSEFAMDRAPESPTAPRT